MNSTVDKKCYSCGNALTGKGKYDVCESCKTVEFSTGLSPDEISDKVKSYLNHWHDKILAHQKKLYNIEKRCISNGELSEADKSLQEWCKRFQSLKTDLMIYIDPSRPLKMDKQFREWLYDLLELDEERKGLEFHWLNGPYPGKAPKK